MKLNLRICFQPSVKIFNSVNSIRFPRQSHIRKTWSQSLSNFLTFEVPIAPSQDHSLLLLGQTTSIENQPAATFFWKRNTGFAFQSIKQFRWPTNPSFQCFTRIIAKLKISFIISPNSSVLSLSGKRVSSNWNNTWSPPSFWYSSGERCSTHSKALPVSSVYTYGPAAPVGSLSIVRILFLTQFFHLRYSWASSVSPEK